MKIKGENRRTWKQPRSSATLTATNPIDWPGIKPS